MRNPSWPCLVCLACLAGGCAVFRLDEERTGIRKEGPPPYVRPYPPKEGTTSAGVADQVRARLPSLKVGMTESQVMEVLKGLPLGEETIVSLTISGGKTALYRLPPRHHLQLEFIPRGQETSPGGLIRASLIE